MKIDKKTARYLTAMLEDIHTHTVNPVRTYTPEDLSGPMPAPEDDGDIRWTPAPEPSWPRTFHWIRFPSAPFQGRAGCIHTRAANDALRGQGDAAVTACLIDPPKDSAALTQQVYDNSVIIALKQVDSGHLACVRYRHPSGGATTDEVVIVGTDRKTPPAIYYAARFTVARHAAADFAEDSERIISDMHRLIFFVGEEAAGIEDISCRVEPFTGRAIREVALPLDPVTAGLTIQVPAKCEIRETGATRQFRMDVSDLELACQELEESEIFDGSSPEDA